ncbi:MAG: hypothetical protein AAF202_05470 [Pseudomonadota bacterium]
MKWLFCFPFFIFVFSVRGDQAPSALDQLVESIGVEDLNEELQRRNDGVDPCFFAMTIPGSEAADHESCMANMRRNLALEASEETFDELQSHLCDSGEITSAAAEDCAHPLIDFYESFDELYQVTCESYCQAAVSPAAHNLITCSEGAQCQNLSDRRDELYDFGMECFQGVRDGGAASLQGLGDAIEGTLRLPYDAYMQLVYIMQMGFHDWMLNAVSNDLERVDDTVRLARAIPGMIENQVRVMRCMDTEIARQYICQFATMAGAAVATAAVARRVALPQLERLLSDRAFEEIAVSRGRPLGNLDGLEIDEVLDRLGETPQGRRLAEELTDEEYEAFARSMMVREEDGPFFAQLITELDTNDMDDLIALIRAEQRSPANAYSLSEVHERLYERFEDFLPQRGSERHQS